MTEKVNMEGATSTILLTIAGQVYAVAVDKEDLETITFLIKRATKGVIPSGKTQWELNEFLGLNKS
ncbi:hypothetical protein [Sporosarcina newyorkensis]|uniref:hypothetical protein n=1 Tax=Sporosarcina newyorkensis TaxID=759851 RepID=UPI003CFF2463